MEADRRFIQVCYAGAEIREVRSPYQTTLSGALHNIRIHGEPTMIFFHHKRWAIRLWYNYSIIGDVMKCH